MDQLSVILAKVLWLLEEEDKHNIIIKEKNKKMMKINNHKISWKIMIMMIIKISL